jgi:ribosomal protein S18 acetylase RimI-like enzyme
VSIRPAQPRDAASIALIHVRTWQAAYRGQLPEHFLKSLDAEIPQRTARWEAFIANAASRRHVQLVAQEVDKVVGFVTFGPSEDEPLDPQVGQVYAIYVNPGHWDRGYGRELFTAAVRGLTEGGFDAATLWVLESNKRARRFYEAAGWVTDGATKTEQRGDVELHEVRYRSAPLQRAAPKSESDR